MSSLIGPSYDYWKSIKQHKKGDASGELWQKREELICRIQDEIQLNIS